MKTLSNIFSSTFTRIFVLGSFFLLLFQNTAFSAESVDCDAVLLACILMGTHPAICLIAYTICLIFGTA